MTSFTTAALIAAAKAGGAKGVGYDLILSEDFGGRWDARDATDAPAFIRRLYMDGFQPDGDPLGVWPFGPDDVVTACEVDTDAVILGEDGDSFSAYQIVPADPLAVKTCVWWDDGSGEREAGFYFDDAEDSGSFGRTQPSGPHSTRHTAELAALDLYRSCRFIDGQPMHYIDA